MDAAILHEHAVHGKGVGLWDTALPDFKGIYSLIFFFCYEHSSLCQLASPVYQLHPPLGHDGGCAMCKALHVFPS